VTVLLALGTIAPVGAQSPGDVPRLAVMLVVDQMRADYVARFLGDWTGGLKRLVAEGAWFTEAAYPYLTTVTCAGHTTLATGTFPRTHGMIANEWWDRARKADTPCTDDPATPDVGYLGATLEGDSAAPILVPTFVDELRQTRPTKVVSLSMKARSAIPLAGHGPGIVAWLNTRFDNWLTSSAYAKTPHQVVKRFLDEHPPEREYGRLWSRILPVSHYREPDDADGERAPPGWTRSMPHVLSSASGTPDAEFRDKLERSPMNDERLTQLAMRLVDSERLGKGPGTDVLAIGFSATDRVGHRFGPHSHEVQDTLARLDRLIGRLLSHLDRRVGRGRYVVALSADHGVTPLAERLKQEGKPGGRLQVLPLIQSIRKRLDAAFGPGDHLAAFNGSNMNVYFGDGIYDRLRREGTALDEIVGMLSGTPGVRRVFRSEELTTDAVPPDPLARAAALSYYPGRSGDLVVALGPGWIGSINAAGHGSANADDQRVPIIFMGPGVRPGRYSEAATPADVAPTLASLVGISMPRAEGRTLRVALIPPVTTTAERH
jgi:hypothetical protein